MMVRKLGAEFIGTFILVFAGCGTAVLAAGGAGEKNIGVGWLGVAIAFGLTVVVGAYALAAISGAHFNPAVTLGLWAGKRFEAKGILPYIAVQIVAAIAAAGVLLLIARDGQGFSLDGGFASNGYGAHSPGNYGITAAILAEFVLTFIFIFVIMGSTDERAPKGFAPLAIGLCLTLVHLVGIPVTNMSVNPARSIGPAVFVGGWAIQQLWLFILVPVLGGIAAGLAYRFLLGEGPKDDLGAA